MEEKDMQTSKCTKGTRNTMVFHMAKYLIAETKGDGPRTLSLLMEWNQKYVEPPLPKSEIKRIAKSVI